MAFVKAFQCQPLTPPTPFTDGETDALAQDQVCPALKPMLFAKYLSPVKGPIAHWGGSKDVGRAEKRLVLQSRQERMEAQASEVVGPCSRLGAFALCSLCLSILHIYPRVTCPNNGCHINISMAIIR